MIRGLRQSTTSTVAEVSEDSTVPVTSVFLPTDEERAQKLFEETVERQRMIEQQACMVSSRKLLDPNETPRGPPSVDRCESMRSVSAASSSVSLVNPASLMRTDGSSRRIETEEEDDRAQDGDDDSSHDSLFDDYPRAKEDLPIRKEVSRKDDGSDGYSDSGVGDVKVASHFNLGVGHHHSELITSDGGIVSDHDSASDHHHHPPSVGSPTGSILPLSGRVIPIDGSRILDPAMSSSSSSLASSKFKSRRRGSSGMIRHKAAASMSAVSEIVGRSGDSCSSGVMRRLLSVDSLRQDKEEWDFHQNPYYVPGDSLRAVPSALIGRPGDRFISDSDGESDSMLQSQLEIENEIAMLRAVKDKEDGVDIVAIAAAAASVFSSSDDDTTIVDGGFAMVDRGEDEVDLGRVDSSVFDQDYGPLPDRSTAMKKSFSVDVRQYRNSKDSHPASLLSVDDDSVSSRIRRSEPSKPLRSQSMFPASQGVSSALKFKPKNPSSAIRMAGSEDCIHLKSEHLSSSRMRAGSRAAFSASPPSIYAVKTPPSLSALSASVSVPMSTSSFDESHASRTTVEVVRRRMTAVAEARKKSALPPSITQSKSGLLSEVKEEPVSPDAKAIPVSAMPDGALLRVMTKLFPFHMIGPINAAEMASAESESTGSLIAEPGCDRSRWYCEYKFCETTVHGEKDTYDGVLCWISERHGFDYILCDTCVLQWKIDSTVIEAPVSPSTEMRILKTDPPALSLPLSSSPSKSSSPARSADAKHRASRYKSIFEKLSQPESPFDTGAEDKNVRRGWLFKRGALVKGYKKRFCVLQSNHKLYYYKSLKANNEKGVADLAETKSISVFSDIDFEIETPLRTWVFKAIDRSECADWVAALSILTGVKSRMRIGEKPH